MELLLRNGGSITMTVEELETVLYSIAKKTADIIHKETVTRKIAIDVLGSRSEVDKYVTKGIINPITVGRNGKWKVLVSELMHAKQLQENDRSIRKSRAGTVRE